MKKWVLKIVSLRIHHLVKNSRITASNILSRSLRHSFQDSPVKWCWNYCNEESCNDNRNERISNVAWCQWEKSPMHSNYKILCCEKILEILDKTLDDISKLKSLLQKQSFDTANGFSKCASLHFDFVKQVFRINFTKFHGTAACNSRSCFPWNSFHCNSFQNSFKLFVKGQLFETNLKNNK